MASDFSDFMMDNKYRYVACGKKEAVSFLIARAALRGEVSDLVEKNELTEDELLSIQEKTYNDKKPLYLNAEIVLWNNRGRPSGEHHMWI